MSSIQFFKDGAFLKIDWQNEAGDGSGDFLVSIETESDGFRGHADGHVEREEFRAFVTALRQLDRSRKGSAKLTSAMPGQFEVIVRAVDSVGHLGAEGMLKYGAGGAPEQELHFRIHDFEQSQIETAVGSVRDV